MGALIKLLLAPLTGFLPIAGVVAAIFAGLAYVRHEIVSTATTKADARCEQRIADARMVQDKEDEAKSHDAENAADSVAHAGDRATLKRVCRKDGACRERQN